MSRVQDFYDPWLYDLEVGDADPSLATLDFYLKKAGTPSRRVLDIGAGTGRLAIPLLQYGHFVVCIDRSEAMLGNLRERARALTPNRLQQMTVLNESFGARLHESKVDVAFAMDDFLLHCMTIDELLTFFQDLASWLDPGGTFVTDIRPRRSNDLLRHASKPLSVRTFGITPSQRESANNIQYCTMFWEEYESGTQKLITTCQYQALSPHLVVENTFYRVLRQRIHLNTEVIQAADESGFRLVELSARNQAGVSPQSDIGGSFEFRLKS